jgi:hypothetical protein
MHEFGISFGLIETHMGYLNHASFPVEQDAKLGKNLVKQGRIHLRKPGVSSNEEMALSAKSNSGF